jgi:hypothetical protein
MLLAGPLGKNEQDLRGIFILNTTGLVEAESLMQTDPAILAELPAVEIYPWYGPAALGAYLDATEQVWKAKP